MLQSMIHIKERKEMEDQFKKAQKPWVKLLQKVNKAKQDYHTACKMEKSAANQERNASGDSSLSPDQVRFSFVNNSSIVRQVCHHKRLWSFCIIFLKSRCGCFFSFYTQIFSFF